MYWLSIAEFVANNTISTAIECLSFFANLDIYPRIGLEPIDPLFTRPELAAKSFVIYIDKLNTFLRKQI